MYTFTLIGGEEIKLSDFKKPKLIVNTASRCGFTGQLSDMQKLADQYKDKLMILAVSSNDFKQELKSSEEVQEFCDLNYDVTFPITEITSVRGKNAHGFFQHLKTKHKYSPKWNFYKVLLDKDDNYIKGYNSLVSPTSKYVTKKIDELLEK